MADPSLYRKIHWLTHAPSTWRSLEAAIITRKLVREDGARTWSNRDYPRIRGYARRVATRYVRMFGAIEPQKATTHAGPSNARRLASPTAHAGSGFGRAAANGGRSGR